MTVLLVLAFAKLHFTMSQLQLYPCFMEDFNRDRDTVTSSVPKDKTDDCEVLAHSYPDAEGFVWIKSELSKPKKGFVKKNIFIARCKKLLCK